MPPGAVPGVFNNDIYPLQAFAHGVGFLPFALLPEAFAQIDKLMDQRRQVRGSIFRAGFELHPQYNQHLPEDLPRLGDKLVGLTFLSGLPNALIQLEQGADGSFGVMLLNTGMKGGFEGMNGVPEVFLLFAGK